jgi:translocator protein
VKLKKTVRFLFALAMPLAVGAVAGMFTADAVPQWYASLKRPAISPPDWLFGPVWTILYLLMGLSFYLVWMASPGKQRAMAMVFFFIQLSLNFFWSFLFFYFRMMGWALVEIVILWLCTAFMLVFFFKTKPQAAYLNIPYFFWISFATILNAAYYHLN